MEMNSIFGTLNVPDIEEPIDENPEGGEPTDTQDPAEGTDPEEGGDPTENPGEEPADQDENENLEDPENTEEPEEPEAGEEPTDVQAFADGIFEDLVNKGYLPEDLEEEFDLTPEGISKMMETGFTQMRERYEATIEQLKTQAATPSEEYKPIEDYDLNNESDQEDLYRLHLKQQGFEDDEIAEEVEEAKSLDKLGIRAAKASKALTILEDKDKKAKEKAAEQSKQEAIEAGKAQRQKLETSIDALDDVMGFKFNDKQKAAFKDYLFKPNPRTGKTQAQENNSYERQLRLAALDFVDFNKDDFTASVESEVNKKQFKRESRFKSTGAKTGGKTKRAEITKGSDTVGRILPIGYKNK